MRNITGRTTEMRMRTELCCMCMDMMSMCCCCMQNTSCEDSFRLEKRDGTF